MTQAHIYLRLATLVIGLSPPSLIAQPIYKCESADGAVAFSDVGCEFLKHRGETYATRESVLSAESQAVNSIKFSPLTATDQARLGAQAARIEENRRRQKTKKQRHRQQYAQELASSLDACSEAEQALARLKQRKRQGYQLSQAPQMDAEMKKWRRSKRKYC